MGYGAPIYIDAHTPEHIIKRMKDKNELETMLGAARFKTYYTAAGNDTEKPVALGVGWNIGPVTLTGNLEIFFLPTLNKRIRA